MKMETSLNGTSKDSKFLEIYDMYVNDIYRLCYSFMKNHMDAEDAVQDTFLKLYRLDKKFETASHIKAWLIVTASNCCKDMLKHWWRRRKNLEDFTEYIENTESQTDEIMTLIMMLPDKYKTTVYLYYYEGYNSKEISELLKRPESTIRTHLQKARHLLKKELE